MATFFIIVILLILGVLPAVFAVKCYQCTDYGTGNTACQNPAQVSLGNISTVNCTHGCEVVNATSYVSVDASIRDFLPGLQLYPSYTLSRDCYVPSPTEDMCTTWCEHHISGSLAYGRRFSSDCTECCMEDFCNDGNTLEAVDEVRMWCFQCESAGQNPCDDPRRNLSEYEPLWMYEVACSTACMTTIDVTSYPDDVVSRSCVRSLDDCETSCEEQDCTFCCQGTLCNDMSRNDIVALTNFTHSCYKCFGDTDSDCGRDFRANSKEVETENCYDGCAKEVSPSTYRRGCKQAYKLDACLREDDICVRDVCTYCCSGEYCNSANSVMLSAHFISVLSVFQIIVLLNTLYLTP